MSGYRHPVKFRYQIVSSIWYNFTGYLPDISVSEIGEIGACKTLERELKSCLTGLTSRAFICRLPDLFQFYLIKSMETHTCFV